MIPPCSRSSIFYDVWQLGYNCIVWNLSDPLFQDARVRRALAMAFDRQTVIDKLYHGQARAVTGPFTPDLRETIRRLADRFQSHRRLGALGLRRMARYRRRRRARSRRQEVRVHAAHHRRQLRLARSVRRSSRTRWRASACSWRSKRSRTPRFSICVLQRNYQAAFLSWVNEPDPDPSDLFHSSQNAAERHERHRLLERRGRSAHGLTPPASSTPRAAPISITSSTTSSRATSPISGPCRSARNGPSTAA